MTKWTMRSKRKITGGLLQRNTKKKKYMRGRDFVPAHVSATKRVVLRSRGGNTKVMMLAANVANISIKGKMQQAKILSVSENPADSQFVRRNIITKGAILETDIGRARVTSRPGQDGMINAVFVETTAAATKKKK